MVCGEKAGKIYCTYTDAYSHTKPKKCLLSRLSTADLTIVVALLWETAFTFPPAVLSWAALLLECARAIACTFPAKHCLAPTSWTGMWGGLWLLLGGAGRMGSGCRGGSCTGKRCPCTVLGWIGTGPLSAVVLACCKGCTTRVCVLTFAFGATEPMG